MQTVFNCIFLKSIEMALQYDLYK